MRRIIEIGAFHVEWQNSLHVWVGSRGLHVFWRDAGRNEPQHRVGRLVVVPDRMKAWREAAS